MTTTKHEEELTAANEQLAAEVPGAHSWPDECPTKDRTRAVWLTDDQLRKLKSLTVARMYRVAKLVDKWNMRGLATMVDSRRQEAHARRDAYQKELDMLEATWSEITACLQHHV